jgi:cysteine desulfurase
MNVRAPIYLDGFSTMPLAPEARDAMIDAWSQPGNSRSPHSAGERSAQLVANGRASVAHLVNAAPAEIFFTSGATESNSLALTNAVQNEAANGRRRIIISAVEHEAVINPTKRLSAMGFSISLAPVDQFGRLDVSAFHSMMDDDVLLASVMAANNETGVIQPIAEAASIAHSSGALFHCDAAQAVGKIPIDVIELDVDYLSISAHKLHGPYGIGALYVASGTQGLSMPVGAYGQGQQLRHGTEPTPLIAGFGVAADLALKSLRADANETSVLALRLEEQLRTRRVTFTRITGQHPLVPGSLAVQFAGVDGDLLCAAIGKTVCISTGSACTSGQMKTSHVLDAMGFSYDQAREVVRIKCNRYNSFDEIDMAAQIIAQAVSRAKFALDDVASGV